MAMDGIKRGKSRRRHLRIQTTLSWQKHWKNGQYPYSNQFFHVFTQLLKKLIDDSAYGSWNKENNIHYVIQRLFMTT